MSGYEYSNNLEPNELARAEDVADEFRAIENWLANFPGFRIDGLLGFDGPLAAGQAVLPQHAVTLGQVNEMLRAFFSSLGNVTSGVLRGYSEHVVYLDDTEPSAVLDATDSNVYVLNMSRNFEVSLYVPATGNSHSITLYLTGADVFTLTIQGTVYWQNGEAPQTSGRDVIILHTVDDGASWFASIINYDAIGEPPTPVSTAYPTVITGDSPAVYFKAQEIDELLAFDSSGNSNNGLYMLAVQRVIDPLLGPNVNNLEVLYINAGHSSAVTNSAGATFIRTPIVAGGGKSLAVYMLGTGAATMAGLSPSGVISGFPYLYRQGSVSLASGSVTFECWIKFTQQSGGTDAKGVFSALDASGNLAMGMRVKGPSGPQFYIYYLGARLSSGVAEPLEFGSTYHLVGVFNNSTKKVSLYVNGELSQEQTHSGATIPAAISEIVIGVERDINGDIVPNGGAITSAMITMGQVSQAAIYNKVLTGEEITAHYEAGLGDAPA
jgi:hypothetical protein